MTTGICKYCGVRHRIGTIISKEHNLDFLHDVWKEMSKNIFYEKFGMSYRDSGQVIGAGVEISKNRKHITKWYGSGMTGEEESFDILLPKIKALGFDAWYNPGKLD